MILHHLSIDIETRSGQDISKTGLYKYAQDPEFKILLFAYKLDDDPVLIVDLEQGEVIPDEIVKLLADPLTIKHAYNAAFEWYCLNRVGYLTALTQWRCTMIHGLYCGYTAGLAATGAAIGLPEDRRKLTTGKALIRYFCVPAKPTKSNGGRRWNLPRHDPDKWQLFKDYCVQDVVTESSILTRLDLFPVPESEWKLWRIDTKMNAFGVRVDTRLMDGALHCDEVITADLMEEARAITGLANPKSRPQLLAWLAENGCDTDDITKDTVSKLLEAGQEPHVERLLQIRQQLGKTSVAKYRAMENAKCDDDRIRGLTQFYGANQTGRWAGRFVQMQNLPRNYLKTLDYARELVKAQNVDGIRFLYGNIPDTLSQLIRTAFIPSDGHKFVVADFSAIEARVIAWLAGEAWVQEVFATHGKIYEATASQMFGVPVDLIKKGNPEYALRQKGKVATLALGYQGGTNALIAMGALNMGLTEEELPDIVQRWRAANPNIVRLWRSVEAAAIKAIETGQPQGARGLIFALEADVLYGQSFLTVLLPSGRKLFYARPVLKKNKFDRMAVHYYSVDQTTRKFSENSTYGGKMTENIVQAIARDCLAETLRRIDKAGYQTVFHVHDEVIVDAAQELTVDALCQMMADPIPWAPGLILKGAGFEGKYYMKD